MEGPVEFVSELPNVISVHVTKFYRCICEICDILHFWEGCHLLYPGTLQSLHCHHHRHHQNHHHVRMLVTYCIQGHHSHVEQHLCRVARYKQTLSEENISKIKIETLTILTIKHEFLCIR